MAINIVIVNAVYPPEPVVSAQMGRDIAEYLAQSGARITVLCPFPSRPIGAEYADFQRCGGPRVDCESSVAVARLPSFRAPQSRFFARMRESWSFGRHVCRYMQGEVGHADVVYANSFPLFSQALIARHCARRGIPLIQHVQDFYPEALLGKVPKWSRGVVRLALTTLDRWIAQRAACVVAISENMRRTYMESRRLTPEKVVTILNWVDERCFETPPARTDACARYDIPEDRFTFLYLGNIGPVAGVESLIEAFHAAGLPRAQLVIAGDGSAKAGCVALAKRLGVNGVSFVSDPDVANVPLLQSLGDVCLLPMRKGAGMSSIPSKVMAYLLSSKPVMATVDAGSDTARCLHEAQCGWVGEPEHVEWLAAKMTDVAALPTTVLEAMGQRGRAYGLKHFSRAAGVKRLADLILGAAGQAHDAGAHPCE